MNTKMLKSPRGRAHFVFACFCFVPGLGPSFQILLLLLLLLLLIILILLLLIIITLMLTLYVCIYIYIYIYIYTGHKALRPESPNLENRNPPARRLRASRSDPRGAWRAKL